MLQKLRDKTQGWPAKIIFAILIFVFSFFGIEGYFQSRADTYVAKVGKQEISQQSYQDQVNKLREKLSREQGDNYDASYVDQPKVKQKVLDGMIDRLLLSKAADDLGLAVTIQQLRGEIAGYQAFQVGGHFNKQAYLEVLRENNMTPQGFQDQVRSQLEVQQLPDLIQQSELVTPAEVNRYLALSLQTRDIHYAEIPRPALTNAKVSDAQVKQYYQEHPSEFTTPEQVSVNYIELSAAGMDVPAPSDDAVRKLYAQEKQQFMQPSEREASHILISVPQNANAAQQKKALAEARKVDALAQAGQGKNFAELANKYSDDLGSKLQGGDLGWVQKGVTNKAFEDALFSMKKGQISKPVLGPDGYHIIWLRDVKQGKVKSLADVRDKLVKTLEKQDREQAFNKLAGKLTDKAYSDPTALQPVAKALSLKLQHTGLFSRKGTQSGLASNAKVVKAAFSANVLAQGNTSDPIKLGKNHIVVIHVDQHVRAKPKPLTEVAGTIRQKILDQRIDDEAHAQAKKLFAQLESSGDLKKVAEQAQLAIQQAKGVSRHQRALSPDLVDKAFKMPHPAKGKPQFAMVSEGNGAYALVELNAVHPGDPSKVNKQERNLLRMQMQQSDAVRTTNAYVNALRDATTIKIAKDRM